MIRKFWIIQSIDDGFLIGFYPTKEIAKEKLEKIKLKKIELEKDIYPTYFEIYEICIDDYGNIKYK